LGSTVGVLALQGDFREHSRALKALGAEVREIRLPADLEGIDGIVLPGGESTTIGKLAVRFGLIEPLRAAIGAGLPTYGTCAGMIFASISLTEGEQPLLGVLDVVVKRNAFGRQLDSFETELDVPLLGSQPVHAVFIRAPVIEKVGPDVDVIARLPDGRIVAVRERNVIATSFHPELAGETRFHRLLAMMAAEHADPGEGVGRRPHPTRRTAQGR